MAQKKTKLEKFLNLAKHMASYSDVYKYKHGACIVRKGKILAQGFNQYKSHPLQRQYNLSHKKDLTKDAPHYIHAEMSALAKLRGQDLGDAEIYVYRVNFEGQPAQSRPCPACMAAIIASGIKKIFYTTPDGAAEEIIDPDRATNNQQRRGYPAHNH